MTALDLDGLVMTHNYMLAVLYKGSASKEYGTISFCLYSVTLRLDLHQARGSVTWIKVIPQPSSSLTIDLYTLE